MNMKRIVQNGVAVAVIEPDGGEIVLSDAQGAMEAALAARYTMGADRLAVPRAAVADAFFVLGTGLAGETLQKLVNYGFKIAFFGDFSNDGGKALRDFIRESNRGRDVFFAEGEAQAVARLMRA